MSEIRPIPFAPGYFVSDDGHVYSQKYGSMRPLKGCPNNRAGHLRLNLRVDGITVSEYVHRLVAMVFIGSPPSSEYEVRHLDGKPANNVRDNLAWGTHAENMHDVIRHGTHGSIAHPERVARGERHGSKTKPDRVARGERGGCAKVTEDQVRQLRTLYQQTKNVSETARRVGVLRGLADSVIQGRTWKHVV